MNTQRCSERFFIAFSNFLLDGEQIAPYKSLLTVLFSHLACDYNVSGNLSYMVSSTAQCDFPS